jgi:formylmethanofuran dehydrogenase subunit D
MVSPRAEQLDEMEIYIRLSKACGAPQFGSRLLQMILQAGQKLHRMGPPFSWFGLGQERMLSILLRLGGQGSFKKLLAEPHGRPLESPSAGTFLGSRVLTESGRLDLAPASFLEAAGTLEADFRRELEKNRGLRLISKREIRTHNSWTHNIEEFIEGERKTNYLYMHPTDAAERSINEGDYVDVTSATGKVRVPARYLTTLKKGVVALPHGWGHQHATGLSVASEAEGVNVNVLVADGEGNLEKLSGMANLTGFSVEVRPATGPPDREDWSGVPEKVRAGSVTG